MAIVEILFVHDAFWEVITTWVFGPLECATSMCGCRYLNLGTNTLSGTLPLVWSALINLGYDYSMEFTAISCQWLL